jgi:hypothetical protein
MKKYVKQLIRNEGMASNQRIENSRKKNKRKDFELKMKVRVRLGVILKCTFAGKVVR